MMGAWLDRQNDPATPPWRTIRFWMAISALIASAVAIGLGA